MMKPPRKKFLHELDTVFNFGKYNGDTVEDVIHKDVTYITWCLDVVKNFELSPEADQLYKSALLEAYYYSRDNDFDYIDHYDFWDFLNCYN